MVSCFVDQKGMDLLIMVLFELVCDWNVVVFGGGDLLLEVVLIGWVNYFCVVFVLGMNELLVYCIYVGVYVFVMFSCFELCGFLQFIVMCYGILFIVCEIGGLVDIVLFEVGFCFVDVIVFVFL